MKRKFFSNLLFLIICALPLVAVADQKPSHKSATSSRTATADASATSPPATPTGSKTPPVVQQLDPDLVKKDKDIEKALPTEKQKLVQEIGTNTPPPEDSEKTNNIAETPKGQVDAAFQRVMQDWKDQKERAERDKAQAESDRDKAEGDLAQEKKDSAAKDREILRLRGKASNASDAENRAKYWAEQSA